MGHKNTDVTPRTEREREREVIERRHVEEEALTDRRRRDLESATGPTVPMTMHEGTRRTDSV